MINAVIFSAFLIFEYKHWGFGFGSFWILIIGFMRLALGLNTLNQLIFGLTIGIWLSFFVFFIINFDNNQAYHFQLVIRGRVINNNFIEEEALVKKKEVNKNKDKDDESSTTDDKKYNTYTFLDYILFFTFLMYITYLYFLLYVY